MAALAAEKGVIFFLVPKADTRKCACWAENEHALRDTHAAGCTTQACGFRDIYPDFTALGFDVYCLSADRPSAQAKWQTKVGSPA